MSGRLSPTFDRWSRAVAVLLLGIVAITAGAQDFPDKSIKIVVAYPAGGPADIAARIVAEQLSQQLPQRVIVDQKAFAQVVKDANIRAE
jgi:tripartite-type tricarboxylate transporter receptor subunit TctC